MAARQDQGLVFTLIAFVILFIIAFVAAYVGWKSYSESETHVAELQNQLNSANSAVATNQGGKEQLSKWMGVGTFDNVEDVEKTFKDDMTRFGANFGADRQSYRNIVEYLAKENESISSREVAAKDQLKETQGPAAGGRGGEGEAGCPVRSANEVGGRRRGHAAILIQEGSRFARSEEAGVAR